MIRSFEESAGSERKAQGSAGKQGHILGALESHALVLTVDEAMDSCKESLHSIIEAYKTGCRIEQVYRAAVEGVLECFSDKEQRNPMLQVMACKLAVVSIVCATHIMQDSEKGENHE